VSVSKRVCPSAVSRNYCKRTLRAWYAHHRTSLGKNDVVIRVKRGYDRREFSLVSEELAKLLRRIA
jgi:ribonuclease P protein component